MRKKEERKKSIISRFVEWLREIFTCHYVEMMCECEPLDDCTKTEDDCDSFVDLGECDVVATPFVGASDCDCIRTRVKE